ncbi:MAG: 50S ribosomal protein L32 [Alphaproteobacteria bacterium]|nr:50S ribosomal protein L32 [Alphaproteobacteria bacterium]
MAVPKKRTSQSRRDKRRSHHALGPNACIPCPKCGELTRPHHVCGACGFYNKKEIVRRAEKAQ